MTIGTGIAIAGVWLFVGACALSRSVSSFGLLVSILIAIGVTVFLK